MLNVRNERYGQSNLSKRVYVYIDNETMEETFLAAIYVSYNTAIVYVDGLPNKREMRDKPYMVYIGQHATSTPTTRQHTSKVMEELETDYYTAKRCLSKTAHSTVIDAGCELWDFTYKPNPLNLISDFWGEDLTENTGKQWEKALLQRARELGVI